MTYKLNGRSIEIEVESWKGETMVTSGNYTDGNMEDLSEKECDEALEQNHGEICEGQLGSAIDRAHDYLND